MLWRIKYALDDSRADKDYGPQFWPSWMLRYAYWTYRIAGLFTRAVCRWRGHPAGVWWFNVGGLEPDMHCKGCGEDLG